MSVQPVGAYNLVMKSASACLALWALSLAAQTPPEDQAGKLNSILQALSSAPKICEADCLPGPNEVRRPSAITKQLVEEITSLAPPSDGVVVNRRWSDNILVRPGLLVPVQRFANALTTVLAGRDLPADKLTTLSAAILDTVDSAAKSGPDVRKWEGERRFRAAVMHAKQALLSLGVGAVDAQIVAERLALIGRDIHQKGSGLDLRLYPPSAL